GLVPAVRMGNATKVRTPGINPAARALVRRPGHRQPRHELVQVPQDGAGPTGAIETEMQTLQISRSHDQSLCARDNKRMVVLDLQRCYPLDEEPVQMDCRRKKPPDPLTSSGNCHARHD